MFYGLAPGFRRGNFCRKSQISVIKVEILEKIRQLILNESIICLKVNDTFSTSGLERFSNASEKREKEIRG